MEFSRRKKQTPTIEMAPLIDVVFLLLTFYMVSSTFVKIEGVPLELPQSTSSEPTDSELITVSIVSDKEIELEGRLLTAEELEAEIRPLLQSAPDRPVLLRSDAAVSVQGFIRTMDALRSAGAAQVTVATSPKS